MRELTRTPREGGKLATGRANARSEKPSTAQALAGGRADSSASIVLKTGNWALKAHLPPGQGLGFIHLVIPCPVTEASA